MTQSSFAHTTPPTSFRPEASTGVHELIPRFCNRHPAHTAMGPASATNTRARGLLYCWAMLLLLVGLQAHSVLGRFNPALHLRNKNRVAGITLGYLRALREVSSTGATADLAASESDDRSDADRQLLGPGSSPPKCTSKCGRCTPCRPVHVPIQPGTLLPAEYYPEAWRCKCGNKLYMP